MVLQDKQMEEILVLMEVVAAPAMAEIMEAVDLLETAETTVVAVVEEMMEIMVLADQVEQVVAGGMQETMASLVTVEIQDVVVLVVLLMVGMLEFEVSVVLVGTKESLIIMDLVETEEFT